MNPHSVGQNYIQTLNDFFKNPEAVRNYASRQKYYTCEEAKKFSLEPRSYAGIRTKSLYTFNRPLFDNLCQKIVLSIFDLSSYQSVNWVMNIYFHLQSSKDYVENTIHRDPVLYAGLVYLTPDIEEKYGTSLYDENHNLAKQIPNIYNSLVAYDASTLHGPSGFVDNRLTLTFFINKLEII